MPTPAGTGMTRRSMLLGSAGMFLTVYGADKLGVDAFETGVAEAFTGPPQAVVVSIFLRRRRRRDQRARARSTTPTTRRCAPRRAWTRPGRSPSTASRTCAGIPQAQGAQGPARRGQGHDLPGDLLRPSQPVALHLAPLLRGRRAGPGRLDRLARPLARPARRRHGEQPDPGPQPRRAALPRARDGARRGRRRDLAVGLRLPEPRRLRRLRRERDGGRLRPARQPRHGPTRSCARRARPSATPRTCAASSRRRSARRRSPTRANNGLANDLRSLVLLLKAGLPIRACAIEGNGGFDTHSDQNGSFGNDIQSNALALKAYQEHLEAEGLADRVITFVWSEFGRRPDENDSNGTDHGAAGVGFLIGSQRERQHDRRVPDARLDRDRPVRQRARDVRLPRRLLLGHRGLPEHRFGDGHPRCRSAPALPGRPDGLSRRRALALAVLAALLAALLIVPAAGVGSPARDRGARPRRAPPRSRAAAAKQRRALKRPQARTRRGRSGHVPAWVLARRRVRARPRPGTTTPRRSGHDTRPGDHAAGDHASRDARRRRRRPAGAPSARARASGS